MAYTLLNITYILLFEMTSLSPWLSAMQLSIDLVNMFNIFFSFLKKHSKKSLIHSSIKHFFVLSGLTYIHECYKLIIGGCGCGITYFALHLLSSRSTRSMRRRVRKSKEKYGVACIRETIHVEEVEYLTVQIKKNQIVN